MENAAKLCVFGIALLFCLCNMSFCQTTRDAPHYATISKPPDRKLDFNALIKDQPMITIDVPNNQNSVFLTWAEITGILKAEFLQEMWEEANITESLMMTFNKYSNIYKKETVPSKITTNYRYNVCENSKSLPVYNVSTYGLQKIKNCFGEFGISSDVIQRDLFSNIANVLRPEHATHNIFYSLRDYNAYFSVSFEDDVNEMAGFITRDFAFVTLMKNNEGEKSNFMTIMMGYTDKLPVLKGNLVYKTDFILAQNDKFSMVVFSTFLDHALLTATLTADYVSLFKDMTEKSPLETIEKLQNQVVTYEATKKCPAKSANPETFVFVMEFAFTHFMVAAGLQDVEYVNMKCFSKFIHELELLRSLMDTCFHNFYFKGFGSKSLSLVAGAIVNKIPASSIKTFTDQQYENLLITLQLADKIQPLSSQILWAAAEVITKIYTRYTETFRLTARDRRNLLDIHMLLRDKENEHKIVNNHNLIIIYLLANSMCNSMEIATVAKMFATGNKFNVYDTFSPCFMSLRYDFSKEKIISESKLNTNMSLLQTTKGAIGFFNLLHDRHILNFDILPVSTCIKNHLSEILMIIPMINVTYVITSAPIEGAINYDVAEAFVQKNLIISAIKSDCHLTQDAGKSGGNIPIPIVYNITRSETECPLCEASFMSYDERDGLESMMFVTNRKVQHNLFLDTSPFFDNQNLHTHYLMLFNNGTVIEIRGKYRERATRLIIITLFILSWIFGGYFVYKLVMYCH
ncbi:envelope glycoprotein H [Vespertilionid gammaherpesvirus 1]|uniref:Envelope glycoprotein H n=1 Tax=Vespertilionid gammaherpesvirus 1 TaxID=2560830 RepID=A0A0X9WR09_9GAMA|nr:envelope glycoprotein H [Myotis gammaherpesvirus 8]AMA67379.1 envelope glycoprotein H [Vespertilionid gammaherpesvirus 1]